MCKTSVVEIGQHPDTQIRGNEFVCNGYETSMDFVTLIKSRYTVGNDCICDWHQGSVNFAS